MGCVENINYARFPKQKNLGSLVNIGQGKLVPAVVVRYDNEEPFRAIFRTGKKEYFQFNELEKLKLPKQGSYFGKKAKVCFHYHTDKTIDGKVVRDDDVEPYLTLLELEDGRVVSATECQYNIPFEGKIEKTEIPDSKDIALISKQLDKRNSSERIRLLKGIYKQLIPSKKGKMSNGQFSEKYSLYRKGQYHFVKMDSSKNSIEILANQIIRQVAAKEFVNYLLTEMRKYNALKNHADRLENFYHGSVQVDMRNLESKPVQIRTF